MNEGGVWLPFCKKCGAELKEDAKFCPQCGTQVGVEKRARQTYAHEREACFGPPGSGGGMWGPYPLVCSSLALRFYGFSTISGQESSF